MCCDDDGYDEDNYDDSMDGDHDSAMESAGWGTDEDYGNHPSDAPCHQIDEDIFLEDQLFPWLADDSMADETQETIG